MAVPQKTFAEDIPLLVSILLREFFAVALLLVLESRMLNYDFLNKPLITFLVLVTVRFPYINSYVYLFESTAVGKWKSHTRYGSRSDAQNTYYFHAIFFLFVVAAHILGGVAAAATRVYFDVQYGPELQVTTGSQLKFGLETNVTKLPLYNSMWGNEDRYTCLFDKGYRNGTRTLWFPMTAADDYCLTVTNIQVWYIGEEAAYVFLLCVCFVHLWLGTGVKDRQSATNPFARDYWEKLFRLSIILTFINVALTRAFPTAHGSFHQTIYNHYLQEWTPDSTYIDGEHSEFFFRVLGGLFGTFLAALYNSSLASTQDSKSDHGFYKLVWGFGREDSQTIESRYEDSSNKGAMFTMASADSGSSSSTGKLSSDFKLRIPYSLS